MDKNEGLSYRAAGVDIDAANESVNMLKKWVDATRRPEVLSDVGGFGGLFALSGQYREPILVAGTDGVGTKLRIAQQLGIHDQVGIDLVAMSVNDILVQGAEPLFFLDYIGVGKLNPQQIEALVKGVSQGCQQAGCSLIGGETAEMPGFYREDEYDLAGFAVGVVEKDKLIDGSKIAAGDVIIALPSSGLHSNGFSLARKVLLEVAGYQLSDHIPGYKQTLGEILLTPTRIYVRPVLKLLARAEVKGMAHITGGGILENVARILPEGLKAQIDCGKIAVPAVFQLIAEKGQIAAAEMFRTFNMGIGFAIIVSMHYYDKALKLLQDAGEQPLTIGRILTGETGVELV